MPRTRQQQPPAAIADFLDGRNLAVAGVSRDPHQPANAILRRLRDTGHRVVPVNPCVDALEGCRCYPDLLSIPGELDGVVIATHPDVAAEIVLQCAARGVRRVWLHRSFGDGSVSPTAVEACRSHGIDCIEGGCPLMFCGHVDPMHRCMRWWLQRRGRVPN